MLFVKRGFGECIDLHPEELASIASALKNIILFPLLDIMNIMQSRI